jgi:death-on-curing family protein
MVMLWKGRPVLWKLTSHILVVSLHVNVGSWSQRSTRLRTHTSTTEDLDLFDLAAVYACSISAAHSFADGNKRTALLAATGFLAANDIDIDHYDQDNLTDWL